MHLSCLIGRTKIEHFNLSVDIHSACLKYFTAVSLNRFKIVKLLVLLYKTVFAIHRAANRSFGFDLKEEEGPTFSLPLCLPSSCAAASLLNIS